MPVLALGLVGAGIGSAIGGTFLGMSAAGIGWAAGTMLGNMLFTKGQQIEGPRLGDLSVQASTYGGMKPIIYGTMRTAGNVIFCTDKREVVSENSEDGKGGPKVTTTTYSYNVDIAISLCEGPIAGIRKIWRNGELIFDVSADADVGTVLGSNLHAEGFKLYLGDESQLPDPTIEATIGVGLTPAYRGTAYVVFDHMDCPNGMIPQLNFEVATVATSGSGELLFSEVPAGDAELTLASIGQNISYQFHSVNGTGAVHSFGPNYYEYERDINFAKAIGGTPIPVQGGPYAMDHYFESASYGDPLHLRAFDLTTGDIVLDYAYVPGSSANSLRPAFAAYDPVTGKFCAVASVANGGRDDKITIMPGGVETALLDKPGAPMAFYDDVIYVCGSRAGITYLQTYDGETGAFIDEVSAGTSVDAGILLVQADNTGVYVIQAQVGGIGTDRSIWKVTDEWTLLTDNANFENANGQVRTFFASTSYAIVGPAAPSGGDADYTLINYASVTPDTVLLADVIEDICVRCGLDASQVDTTGLVDEVNGYALTQVASGRANLEPLLAAFSIDTAESDGVLKFRKRALQTVVATVGFDDLGAIEAGSDAIDPFPLTRTQEAELPRSVAVSFLNMNADYQAGTETARRQVTESINDIATNLPIATYPDHMAQVAAIMLYDTWQARNQRMMKLPRKYAYLDVSDNVSVEYPEGTFTTKRINRILDTGLLLECEVTDADPAIYSVSIPGATPSMAQDGIAYAYPTKAYFLDIPILRNADDDDGFYMALRSVVAGSWPGALIHKSDGLNYLPVVQATTQSVMGVTLTALDDWTGLDVVDEHSSVQVDVGHGELSSSTRAAIISGETNALLIGSEVVQFHTATEDSSGSYTLTGFLRGRRGTEWAMVDHVAGERVVLLTTAMRRIELTLAEKDAAINYKAVTIGSNLAATAAHSFTNTAIGKKPFSPVYLRMQEVSGERLFTWERRSRMATNILTDSIPLGEETESYDVELLDGDGDVVFSDTVSEREAIVSALTEQFELSHPSQMLCEADGDIVGVYDAYPIQINAISLRRFSADGTYLDGVSLGVTGMVTAMLAVGSAIYVATIDGSNQSLVRRYDANNLVGGAQATYVATQDADAQGLAWDGTALWVAEAYEQALIKLNATTLVVEDAHTSIPCKTLAYSGGYLYAGVGDEVRKVDAATGSVALTFTCVANAADILVVGSLIWVAGISQIGVYNTSGVEQYTTVGGTGAQFRRGLVLLGTEVVACDSVAGQLVFFSSTTGFETRRVNIDGIWGVAGVFDDMVFAAIRTGGSDITTKAYASEDDLTGFTFKVYQNSSHVGRGYAAELAL